jgi:hypothetical protein
MASFQGQTYEPALDEQRLTRQLDRVRIYTLGCDTWRTLAELEHVLHYPQASISARLRQLRSLGYTVERRRRGDGKAGLHEYRVTKSEVQ